MSIDKAYWKELQKGKFYWVTYKLGEHTSFFREPCRYIGRRQFRTSSRISAISAKSIISFHTKPIVDPFESNALEYGIYLVQSPAALKDVDEPVLAVLSEVGFKVVGIGSTYPEDYIKVIKYIGPEEDLLTKDN